jgi:hypothetical protein
MRRVVLLWVAIACLVLPSSMAGAQAPEISFEEVIIQVWPEYDEPKALVIYDFKLAPTVLPVTVQIRIPGDGELFAFAQYTEQGLMNVPYDSPVADGDYNILTLTLTELATYHLEYYTPLERIGNLRQYALDWPGDYAITSLNVFVQKPIGARNLSTTPEMPEMLGRDGFVYAQGQFSNLPAGETFSIAFQYEKDDESLSITNLPTSITGTLDTAQGSTFPLTSSLPWLLGGFGAALIAGGVLWFWYSGQGRAGNRNSVRKRHTTRSEGGSGEQVYCSQCGKRAEGSDRFCRACGARLRHA